MCEPLDARKSLLEREVLPKLADPVRHSPELRASLADLVQCVKAQGLEGVVAKRRDSRDEPGQRSGVWRKMRINRAQEFVIGGYTIGGGTFDALILESAGGQPRPDFFQGLALPIQPGLYDILASMSRPVDWYDVGYYIHWYLRGKTAVPDSMPGV